MPIRYIYVSLIRTVVGDWAYNTPFTQMPAFNYPRKFNMHSPTQTQMLSIYNQLLHIQSICVTSK